MAGNDLTGDFCGTQNPLVRLAGHVTQDTTFRESMGHGASSAAAREAPSTIQMEELLHNVEGLHVAPVNYKSTSTVPRSAWASEFANVNATRRAVSADAPVLRLSEGPQSLIMQRNPQMLFQHQPLGPDATVPMGGETWASRYLSKMDHNILDPAQLEEKTTESRNEDNALKEAAQDFVRDVNDEDIQGTSFMKYVRDLAGSTTDVQENYNDLQELDDSLEELRNRTTDYDDEVAFWQRLEETYQKHFLSDSDGASAASSKNIIDNYDFVKDNEHMAEEDPFAKGVSYLKEGNIPEAVLCFEAAVQKQPYRAEAWERLGLVLAENEQELSAIAACRACLELQPDNGNALLSLARSFTNELLNRDACAALMRWLKSQQQYAHLFSDEAADAKASSDNFRSSLIGSFGRLRSYAGKEEFDQTESLLLQAVRTDPSNIDPDLQIALGILYNVSGDYDKAVDCFQTALKVRNDDPLLWNKLGATLANSHRSEMAVAAYHRALELAPGFVRARSNLSIAFIEMNAFWEAIEQGLIAANLQMKSTIQDASSMLSEVATEGIWSLMRMAAMRMDSYIQLPSSGMSGQGAAASLSRQELLNFITDRNLDRLNDLFEIFS